MKTVNALLFDGFTTLDALGPAEVLGRLKDEYEIRFLSLWGGIVAGSAGTRLATEPLSDIGRKDILLVPGGFGTRTLVDDAEFMGIVKGLAGESETVLGVCTGSALLARAGVLRHKRATSNKLSWDWVITQGPEVHWVRKARWVVDGKFYTSSGVAAGIDMTLGFIADRHGFATVRKISRTIEYLWNENRDADPFA